MFDIPAMLKVFAVFCLILILNRFKLQLSISLLIGSLALGFWMGMSPVRWFETVLISMSSLMTISLVIIIWLILIMSRMMKDSGHMNRLVDTFTHLSTDPRTVGAFMAALIGLLPMPGGALFSAPLVESSLSGEPVNREQKAILNFWFRHIWEYWWPLYPGVVLAVALLEVETWFFMAVMMPMTLLSIAAGIFFILRPMGKTENNQIKSKLRTGIKAFLWETMPILIVIFVIIAQAGAFRVLELFGIQIVIPGVVSILPGIALSIIWVYFVNHLSFRQFISVVTDKSVLPIVFLIASIMIFKEVMSESRAVIQIRNELIAFNIPVMFVILIMPFISGFITGIAIGFVGASFPLIIPLLESDPVFHYLSLAGLAYTFGYLGMMLSPVHLCLLVTKDYYKASLFKTYRHLFKPVFSVMAAASLLFIITRAFY